MNYSTLISAAQLLQVREPSWVILDCRHELVNPDAGRQAYAAGHLAGAAFAHLDEDLSGAKRAVNGDFRGRHPLPERAALIEKCRAWGINADTQVIAYDAHGGMFAARLWWLLRWVGHASVAVLDGGLPAWLAAGFPVTQVIDEPVAGNINEQSPLTTLVTVAEVQANLTSQQKTVLDARSPDRFRGENETLDAVGGHIPQAKNRFFKDNLQASGCFKSAATLRDEFFPLIGNPQQAVMQCGSGVTACHNLLALEIAGLSGAALYPGSWSEWCANPARPIAIG